MIGNICELNKIKSKPVRNKEILSAAGHKTHHNQHFSDFADIFLANQKLDGMQLDAVVTKKMEEKYVLSMPVYPKLYRRESLIKEKSINGSSELCW